MTDALSSRVGRSALLQDAIDRQGRGAEVAFMMNLLRKFLTPAGALAALAALWLPWADVTCRQIHTTPDYWQLAGYDHRLYVLFALLAVVALCGLWNLMRRRRSVALAVVAAAASATAAAVWCYLWIRKDELAAYQAQLAAGEGDLARMLQDLQVQIGPGFKLYLVGALLALAGAILCFSRGESHSPR